VLVVPADLIQSVIAGALEKARAEKVVRRQIEEGLSAQAASEKHRIL
jgi:regulator of RNase E activity RraA